MNRAILARLERIIQNRIAAKKELGKDYDFMRIKREVLNEFKGDVGQEREAYSSELSKRFGSEGGKKSAANKRAAKKEASTTLAEAILDLQIAEAEELERAEKERVNN